MNLWVYCFVGTVSRNILISWPMSFGIFVFFGAVSRNMLIPWPMSFGIVVFFGTVSKNMLLSGLWALQFWDCLEKYAHMSIFFETVFGMASGIAPNLCCDFLGMSRGVCLFFALRVW